jgi:hypothetical protein
MDGERIRHRIAGVRKTPMTKLQPESQVVRETACFYRNRALVVKLRPRHIEIRQKGKHHTLMVPYDTLWDFAQKLHWKMQQAEKSASRRRNL